MKKLTLLFASLVLLLTGCARMDSAATVGTTEIKLETLQGRVDAILAERLKFDTSQMR